MAHFLSSEWIAELDRLLRAATPPAEIPNVVIEQHVGSGDDAVTYMVRLGVDGCSAGSGGAADATIVYRQTRATAIAVATEQRSAHEAFMLGDLRVEGDSTALAEALPALEWLGSVLEPLRDTTTFDTQ